MQKRGTLKSILMLTFPILHSSKMALIGPIFITQKASPANSDFSTCLHMILKGPCACKYPGISLTLTLKSTIIPKVVGYATNLHK